MMHSSSAQKENLPLPARREAAGGEKRGSAGGGLVQNHWLHPDKLGGGGDTDKPSIDKPMAKKVALSN